MSEDARRQLDEALGTRRKMSDPFDGLTLEEATDLLRKADAAVTQLSREAGYRDRPDGQARRRTTWLVVEVTSLDPPGEKGDREHLEGVAAVRHRLEAGRPLNPSLGGLDWRVTWEGSLTPSLLR